MIDEKTRRAIDEIRALAAEDHIRSMEKFEIEEAYRSKTGLEPDNANYLHWFELFKSGWNAYKENKE